MRKVKLFLLCLTCISILCGCGKKEEELPIQEDVVETINMKVEEVMLLSLPTTLEELWSYTPEEFADYLPQCIPNYREYFKIEEDKELTIEDWTNLQEILSYQLFKEGKPSEETVVGYDGLTEEDSYFLEKPYEEINNMNDAEFITYMTDLYAYMYPEEEAPDFTKLTSEDIKKIKEEMAAEYQYETDANTDTDVSTDIETDNIDTENTTSKSE